MTPPAMTSPSLFRPSEPIKPIKPLEQAEPVAPTETGLTIGDVARQSGLSQHTLRYYERIGLIAPIPRDSSSKHRRYPPHIVGLAETLACLRETGMSLNGIRCYLRLREQGAEGAAQQKALFAAHKNALESEAAAMQRRIEYVAGKVAFWEAVEAGDAATAQQIADLIWRAGQSLMNTNKQAQQAGQAGQIEQAEQEQDEIR